MATGSTIPFPPKHEFFLIREHLMRYLFTSFRNTSDFKYFSELGAERAIRLQLGVEHRIWRRVSDPSTTRSRTKDLEQSDIDGSFHVRLQSRNAAHFQADEI